MRHDARSLRKNDSAARSGGAVVFEFSGDLKGGIDRGGTELVIDANADDVVGDARAVSCRERWYRARRQNCVVGERAEIDVEIFDSAGPVAGDICFQPGTRGP